MTHATLSSGRKIPFFKRALYFAYIRLYITWGRIFEFFSSLPTYYQHPRLFVMDLSLTLYYLGFSAYKIHSKYMEAIHAKEPDAYGDTPLSALKQIAHTANISAQDRCLDLGCGIGKVGFTWNLLYGCQYTGVDINPLFIKRAKNLSRLFKLSTHFTCMDMRKMDTEGISLVYLYGTFYSDQMIQEVYNQLLSLRAGARVITVSYPLTDWDKSGAFQVADAFTCSFPWGEAQVFISTRVDN